MSFSSAEPSQSQLLADKSWRRRHSAWMLAPILGFGILSFVGFLYIAIRARSRKLWTAAAISGVASALVWIVMALAGDLDESTGKTGEASTTSDLGGGVAVAVWVALIVYAVLVNRDYLRWRAGSVESRAWYNQPVGGSASAAQQPQAQAPGFLGISQSDYLSPAPPPAPPAPAAPVPSTPPRTPIDVNSTTAAALAERLGIDAALASRVIAVRDERGGFANEDDLVSGAGLQPHEFLKFRGWITFGASAPRMPSHQDQVPQTPAKGQPGGRILDI